MACQHLCDWVGAGGPGKVASGKGRQGVCRGRRAPPQNSHAAPVAAQGQAAWGRPFKAWMLCHRLRSLEFLSDVTRASYHQIHFSSCL